MVVRELARSATPAFDVGVGGQRDEDLGAGGLDPPADVALAGRVIGQEDVADAELTRRSVADLDLDAPRQMNHELTPRRLMEVVHIPVAVGTRLAEERCVCGDLATQRSPGAAGVVQRDLEVLEMRLAIIAGVDTCDLHLQIMAEGCTARRPMLSLRPSGDDVSMNEPAISLHAHPVHLGLGAAAVSEPAFTGEPAWYEAYIERHRSDGAEGRLVSMANFDGAWEFWEMHPSGAEMVLCTEGTLELVREIDGGEVTTVLGPGEYAINEAGVWHTANSSGQCTALFITAGLGTEHRPR